MAGWEIVFSGILGNIVGATISYLAIHRRERGDADSRFHAAAYSLDIALERLRTASWKQHVYDAWVEVSLRIREYCYAVTQREREERQLHMPLCHFATSAIGAYEDNYSPDRELIQEIQRVLRELHPSIDTRFSLPYYRRVYQRLRIAIAHKNTMFAHAVPIRVRRPEGWRVRYEKRRARRLNQRMRRRCNKRRHHSGGRHV